MALPKPSFGRAAWFWLKLGCISFGGPAGQIALMQTELVERRRWIEGERFAHALNFCMLLPGPEAQQLATYCGWLLHGTRGGLVAGGLFVLPAAVLLWGLSWFYAAYGAVAGVAGVFGGLKAAVLAIVLGALWRLGRRALRTRAAWGLAAGAFGLLFFARVPFPVVVIGALAIGWWRAEWFGAGGAEAGKGEEAKAVDGAEQVGLKDGGRRLAKIVGVGLVFWVGPTLAAVWWGGGDGVLAREGWFFSKAAVVTFGGAYAVLPYVAQQAVHAHGWLSAPQMVDGLGLAETTPGPLVMVLQFVGFMGGWKQPGNLPPIVMATLGAALTTWVTFVPCFLWIFAGAPYVERLRRHRGMSAALAAVTAAVVGVVLNLAVWFGWTVAWRPGGGVAWAAIGLAVAAGLALERWKVNVVWVVLGCAAAGWWVG